MQSTQSCCNPASPIFCTSHSSVASVISILVNLAIVGIPLCLEIGFPLLDKVMGCLVVAQANEHTQHDPSILPPLVLPWPYLELVWVPLLGCASQVFWHRWVGSWYWWWYWHHWWSANRGIVGRRRSALLPSYGGWGWMGGGDGGWWCFMARGAGGWAWFMPAGAGGCAWFMDGGAAGWACFMVGGAVWLHWLWYTLELRPRWHWKHLWLCGCWLCMGLPWHWFYYWASLGPAWFWSWWCLGRGWLFLDFQEVLPKS